MAGISFLDLLFAEAIAAGLARQAMRAEQPPPENFFQLPKDPRAWKLIHAKNKAENMVCAIEITNNGRENCRRVQPLFIDLAREFDGIPFLQVAIEPGATYDELRDDLGGVQYTPSILVLFYDDDGVARAKFEGTEEIRKGMATGLLKEVIREFIRRRNRLKATERMAEALAIHVAGMMISSEQQRRSRSGFEERMRTLAEEKKKESEKMKKKDELKQHEDEIEELRRKLREKETAAKGIRDDLQKI